jgi:hypothetical protein
MDNHAAKSLQQGQPRRCVAIVVAIRVQALELAGLVTEQVVREVPSGKRAVCVRTFLPPVWH